MWAFLSLTVTSNADDQTRGRLLRSTRTHGWMRSITWLRCTLFLWWIRFEIFLQCSYFFIFPVFSSRYRSWHWKTLTCVARYNWPTMRSSPDNFPESLSTIARNLSFELSWNGHAHPSWNTCTRIRGVPATETPINCNAVSLVAISCSLMSRKIWSSFWI